VAPPPSCARCGPCGRLGWAGLPPGVCGIGPGSVSPRWRARHDRRPEWPLAPERLPQRLLRENAAGTKPSPQRPVKTRATAGACSYLSRPAGIPATGTSRSTFRPFEDGQFTRSGGPDPAEVRLRAGRTAPTRQARPCADLAEASDELAALLAKGAGMLPQVPGLLDELVCRGGRVRAGDGMGFAYRRLVSPGDVALTYSLSGWQAIWKAASFAAYAGTTYSP
jgi:hypothetical protein